MKSTWKHRKPLSCPLECVIDLFLKRDRDIDSSFKLLFDLLEDCGVIKNDKQIESLIVSKQKSVDPRLEIDFYELE